MSRKNIIIIISVVSVLIVGVLLLRYFNASKNQIQNQVSTTTNPFGTNQFNNVNVVGTGTVQTNQPAKNLAKLIQLYKNPTSGSVFFTNKDNKNIIRFVDRGNGNIYEYLPDSQSGQATRLTNITIPKIEEVVWSSTGNNLILRYLDNDTDNIVSFLATIKNATGTSSEFSDMTGVFTSPNIKQLAVTPSGNKVFALMEKNNGLGSYGTTLNFDGSGKKQVFDSPLYQWNISWPKESLITFTSKPSYKSDGYLFFFNTQTSSMDKVLGDILGLTTLTNRC